MHYRSLQSGQFTGSRQRTIHLFSTRGVGRHPQGRNAVEQPRCARLDAPVGGRAPQCDVNHRIPSLTPHSRSFLHVRPARRVSWTRSFLPRVQPCSPRRASCSARPLSSAGIAPLPRYYGPICQPCGRGGRSSSVLCFRYSPRESPRAFPSSFTYPFPGMPRSQTPAASPAQSPNSTPTGAFPLLDTVGHCTISVTGLDHFTLVAACRSLCLRFVVLVASHDAKLDCRWLAGPWRRRNYTSWIDEASSGRTQSRVSRVHGRVGFRGRLLTGTATGVPNLTPRYQSSYRIAAYESAKSLSA
jgi:hypothetical protein